MCMKKDENREQKSRSRQKIFRITKISLSLLFVFMFQARATSLPGQDGNVLVKATGMETAQTAKETKKIKGKIVDRKGLPLVGATVMIKGTTMGVMADTAGRYVLQLPDVKDLTLVFRFMGMETKEIKLKDIKDEDVLAGKKDYLVTLVEEINSLDDVVVTGIGNVRKESYTGAITRVEGKELMKVANRNIIAALQVFDPSFRIMENNEMGSNPNAVPEFYIRGQSGIGNLATSNLSESQLRSNPNLPLFILDGLETTVETLYDMDPNRIHSVTLLKDASATAIYGSKAANGVVVIETVAPKAGQFHISYSLTGSVTAPDLSSYDYMSGEEHLATEIAAGFYDATGVQTQNNYGQALGNTNIQSDFNAKARELWDRQMQIASGVNTDWMALPLRVGYNHKHSVSIDGGNDIFRYGISLGYDAQKGVMKKDFRNNLYASLRMDYRTQKLVVINRFEYRKTENKNSPYGSFGNFVKQLPYNTPYDANGNIVKNLTIGAYNAGKKPVNPLWEGEMTKNYSGSTSETFSENLQVNWYLHEHLKIDATLGLNRTMSDSRNFVDPNSGEFTTTDGTGRLSLSSTDSYSVTTRVNLLYNNAFNDGADMFTFNLAMDTYSQTKTGLTTRYEGFPSGELSSPMFAQTVVDKPTEEDNCTRTVGWLAKLNYSHKNIYMFDISYRLDGSSEFGSNKTYAPFFSFGGGINLHNYAIFQDSRFMQQLKLTWTYGRVGSQNFSPYAARHIYAIQTEDWYKTGMSVNLTSMGNPDLTWQVEDQYNLGLQANFFNGLLQANFSYYREETKDMVSNVTIPSSFGFTTYYDNVGKARNVGYDITLSANVIQRDGLFVNVFGNTNHNKNEILAISNSLKAYNEEMNEYYNQLQNSATTSATKNTDIKLQQKFEEGASTTAIWGMKSLGIDPTTGKEVFVRRDGSITYEYEAAEQQVLGDKLPKMQGSFGVNATWKKWSLFASFMYEWGGEAYNTTLPNRVETVDLYNWNADKRVMSMRWYELGDITPMKNIKDRLSKTYPSSRFVQKNNFVEFNSLTLDWTESEGWVERWGLSQVQFSFTMNDIAHWSTIKRERGTDYPFAWNFDFSIRVSF